MKGNRPSRRSPRLMQRNEQEAVEEKKVVPVQEVVEERKNNQEMNSAEIPPTGSFEEQEVEIVFHSQTPDGKDHDISDENKDTRNEMFPSFEFLQESFRAVDKAI